MQQQMPPSCRWSTLNNNMSHLVFFLQTATHRKKTCKTMEALLAAFEKLANTTNAVDSRIDVSGIVAWGQLLRHASTTDPATANVIRTSTAHGIQSFVERNYHALADCSAIKLQLGDCYYNADASSQFYIPVHKIAGLADVNNSNASFIWTTLIEMFNVVCSPMFDETLVTLKAYMTRVGCNIANDGTLHRATAEIDGVCASGSSLMVDVIENMEREQRAKHLNNHGGPCAVDTPEWSNITGIMKDMASGNLKFGPGEDLISTIGSKVASGNMESTLTALIGLASGMLGSVSQMQQAAQKQTGPVIKQVD